MSFFVIQVAVPVPLRRQFDYLPLNDDGLKRPEHYPAGIRVRVTFGNQLLTGLVLGTSTETDVPRDKLKPVEAVLDSHALIDAQTLTLGQWLANYYHHSIGEVLELMIPTMLRQGCDLSEANERVWVRNPKAPTGQADTLRGKRQQALWYLFESQPDWPHSRLTTQGFSLKQLQQLEQRQLIAETSQLPRPPLSTHSAEQRQSPLPLNTQQQTALDGMAVTLGDFQTHLLEGVTGSGKTEVYLQLIEQALERRPDGQILVLVPEIGLTPQTVQRFRRRFEMPVALLHSGLNDRERLQAWRQCREQQVGILIGTRSAVFTPLPNLCLIILDEEHDASFKQQDGLRYSARDFALVRARHAQVPVVLGSATPSLETLHNALTGRYQHWQLTQRAGGARPPGMKLHNILHQPLTNGLAQPVLAAIQQHLQQGQQVLVFINRRGYAPLMACQDCGWMAECRRCDARMTIHQSPPHLHCHHCDFQQGIPGFCPECHSSRIQPVGHGTERVQQTLMELFPDVPVTRVDRDTVRTKQAFDQLLEEIHGSDARILIGTQMLAKGHHFPKVTLVVVLDADVGLFSADFRGMEHTAQLILQVAGRAGREQKPGDVWIQTLYADHPQLNLLIDNGYHALALALLQERQQQQLPPYSHMVLLRAESTERHQAEKCLRESRSFLQQLQEHWRRNAKKQRQKPLEPLNLMGPFPAIMERRAGRFRHQLQLYCHDRRSLHAVLDPLVDFLQQRPDSRKVRWHLDVDPMDTL
ncbi:MAG: primosomal protein N' [Oceanospirillaceae bacterium]|nr:primosomal protein N' [Oceanospirillaceae bacterium]